MVQVNFDNKLKSIRSLLSLWSWRFLSVFGKITVIKTMAMPIIIHLLRALPNPDDNFFKEYNQIIFDFIWDKKQNENAPDKIKRAVLINDFTDGGANLTDIEVFSKSIKIYWIQKLLDDTYITDWKRLFLDQIKRFGGNFVWLYHQDSIRKIANNLNPFWKNLLNIWAEIIATEYSESDVRIRTIWFNPEIRIGHNYISRYSNAGINFICDLFDEEGHFLLREGIMEKYNIEIDFLTYASLKRNIPESWKRYIENNIDNAPKARECLSYKILKHSKPNKII